jgi:DNA-directed RNA polymerase specialized sigma24 family protein
MAESIELYGSLHAAIGSLSPQLWSIVQLRCFVQLTFAEIGRLLNMPETNVKMYFYHSLPRLHSALTSNVPCSSIS